MNWLAYELVHWGDTPAGMAIREWMGHMNLWTVEIERRHWKHTQIIYIYVIIIYI